MRVSRRVSGKEQPRTEARMKGSEGEVSWLRQRGGISTHWERERGARREIHPKSVAISTVRRHMRDPVFRRNFGLLFSLCLSVGLSSFPLYPSFSLSIYSVLLLSSLTLFLVPSLSSITQFSPIPSQSLTHSSPSLCLPIITSHVRAQRGTIAYPIHREEQYV